jgi:hypothetical protein
MRARCRASCAMTLLYYRLVTNSGDTAVLAVAAKPKPAALQPLPRDSVRPLLDPFSSRRGCSAAPSSGSFSKIAKTTPCKVECLDSQHSCCMRPRRWPVVTPYLIPSSPSQWSRTLSALGTFVASQYNDYIFIQCMRISHGKSIPLNDSSSIKLRCRHLRAAKFFGCDSTKYCEYTEILSLLI